MSVALRGGDFARHDGRALRAVLVDATSGEVVAGPVETRVAGGRFALQLPGVQPSAGTYVLEYYVDSLADGRCSPAPADAAWKVELAGLATDRELGVGDSYAYADVCGSFGEHPALDRHGLVLLGSDLADLEGRTWDTRLRDWTTGELVPLGGGVVRDGQLVLEQLGVLTEGHAYALYLLIDGNQDGSCNVQGADPAWIVPIHDISGPTLARFSASDVRSSVCDAFGDLDLTVTIPDLEAYEGMSAIVTLRHPDGEPSGDDRVIDFVSAQVIDGTAQVTVPSVLAFYEAYAIDVFVDSNLSCTCDDEPDDLHRRVTFVAGHEAMHSTVGPDAAGGDCASFPQFRP